MQVIAACWSTGENIPGNSVIQAYVPSLQLCWLVEGHEKKNMVDGLHDDWTGIFLFSEIV
jgi:hypothetical protein